MFLPWHHLLFPKGDLVRVEENEAAKLGQMTFRQHFVARGDQDAVRLWPVVQVIFPGHGGGRGADEFHNLLRRPMAGFLKGMSTYS